MTQVSITEAAKLANISRATFYRSYINTGVVSVIADPKGKKKVDTSELLRVFGQLHRDSETPPEDVKVDTVDKKNNDGETLRLEVELLKIKLAAAEQQVQTLQQDKNWYQSQISNLTDSIKLLEAPKHSEPVYPRLWWQFWK